MNCLPPSGRKLSPRRGFSRPGHLLTSFSRDLLNPRCNQLYHDSNQHETTRPLTISDTFICLIRTNYRGATSTIPASSCRRHHHTANRPQPKHHIFRPSRRRRPSPVPTPILILRPSRSLHPYSPRIWHHLPRSCLLRRKKRTIWLHRNGMSHAIHRIPRVHRLSTPHVHRRNGRRHPSILYIRYYNYCYPNRNQSL